MFRPKKQQQHQQTSAQTAYEIVLFPSSNVNWLTVLAVKSLGTHAAPTAAPSFA